jgi:hypothetical protein
MPVLSISRPSEVTFPPVLDMLAVRYAIFRGVPPRGIKPRFRSEDYWVLENLRAMPRLYIPRRVEGVSKDEDALAKLALPSFDPREVAYVNASMAMSGAVRGRARIKEEEPTRIVVDAQMQTRGLLVLADNWDKGWHAWVNGKPTQILRANYTIRGVIVPAGSNTVVFRYESPALALGNQLAVGALAVLFAWTMAMLLRRRRLSHMVRAILGQGSSPLSAARTA